MINLVMAMAARNVQLIPDAALISITTPDATLRPHGGWRRVHRLVVSDMDGSPWDHKHGPPVVFTEEHAVAIWAFVRGLPNDVTTLLVHCDAGISRSPAVATVIADELGADLQVSRLAQPNKLIMDALRGAL